MLNVRGGLSAALGCTQSLGRDREMCGCWDGTLGRRWRQVWDAMLSEWRARRSFLGCMQSLRRGRARMGDSHWDATLGCRWIRSLGLRSLWAVTEMRRDVWKLTVIGSRNGMDEMVQGSVVGYGSYWDATGDV